jgi:hypothetical protein
MPTSLEFIFPAVITAFYLAAIFLALILWNLSKLLFFLLPPKKHPSHGRWIYILLAFWLTSAILYLGAH